MEKLVVVPFRALKLGSLALEICAYLQENPDTIVNGYDYVKIGGRTPTCWYAPIEKLAGVGLLARVPEVEKLCYRRNW